MPTRSRQGGRGGAVGAQDAAQRSPASISGPLPPEHGQSGDVAPRDAQNAWRLWFAARPFVPVAMRGRTKTGKPKKSPPRLPPNINERTRMHWRTERRLTGYWRLEAFALGKAQRIPPCQRVRVSAVVYREWSVEADESGDAERLKPLIDGLKDAGVIPDDTYRHVEHGGVRAVKASISGIELIVEEIQEV